MSKARELAELGAVYDSGALSNRNLVINGAMMVSQRATSVSSQTGAGYKTIDRIYTNASGSIYNQSQQTVTVGGETGLPTQFTKFLRHDVTTSNDNAHFYHKIEDVASVPEGTVTLSFYAKGTTPTGGLAFAAYQNFGTGGSPSSEVAITISDTVTLTSTWQRFSVNITVPSITGKTLGTNGNSHFYFGIGQMANTSTNAYQLDIIGLQLEVGSEATPFEHRSFADELARCERYFQTYSKRNWQGTNEHSGNYKMYVDGVFRQKMRAAPSASFVGTVTIGRPQVAVTQRPDSIGGLSTEGFQDCGWPSSGTYGGSLGSHGDAYYRMAVGDGPTNRIDFDAEL